MQNDLSPLDDLEYHALYYDVTDGAHDFIDDMSINVHDRTQRTFVQRITLPRPRDPLSVEFLQGQKSLLRELGQEVGAH